MRQKRFWVCFGLCAVWTLFVFSRSLKSGVESSAESGAVMELLRRAWDLLGIDWLPSEHFVRKMGHFTEYFILGALALPSARLFLRRFAPLLACGYAAAVALLDEFLMQNLSVGRGPSFSDVLIDLFGTATAVFFLLAAQWVFGKKNKF